jgi:ABC-2 type transport system permease protein
VAGLALKLRLALMRNSLRGGPGSGGRQTAFGLSIVAGCGLALLGLLLLGATRGRDPLSGDAAAVLYTVLLGGWAVLPIITFAGDYLLDPAKLALLPLTRRDRMTLLAVAGVVTVPAAATLIASLGLVVGSSFGSGASYVVGIAAAVLEVALCVVISRTIATALSGLLRSRRGRDIGVAITMLVALSFQLINPLMQRLVGSQVSGTAGLHQLARAVSWTPPALLARAPGLARDGHLDAALGSLVLVAGFVAWLLLVWERLVGRALERVDASGGGRRRRAAPTSPVRRRRAVPGGRVAAVATKDLRYLVRDPRRLIGMLMGMFMPALVIVLGPYGSGRGLSDWAVFAVCLVALFGGLTGANRFGQDGTSTWLLLATQVDRHDPRRDLLGGDVATVTVLAPVIITAALIVDWLGAGDRYLAAAIGSGLALLLIGVAASAIPAVFAPFAVPENAGNAFGGGAAGQGCFAGLVSMGCMAGCAVLALPLLTVLLPAMHSPGWGWALLVIGPLYGLVIGYAIREWTSRRWRDRGPEILQLLATTKS